MTSDRNDALALRASAFRQLHESGIFVMPCAWDAISARLFERAGFLGIGTTSGGVNWTAARPDYVYNTPRDQMLNTYQTIASSVSVPTSADLENGYSNDPRDVADLISSTIQSGIVGGSIEDHDPTNPTKLVPLSLAVEKIAAASEAAGASKIDFTLTARSEALYAPIDDPFSEAIDRAQRYAAAGADCIFIPGLSDLDQIRETTQAISVPISVGIGSGGSSRTLAEFAEAGVRRVSTGGAIPRAVFRLIERAGNEALAGTFSFAEDAIAETALNELLEGNAP